ncbi:MAG TPA: thiamine pyrophosphate-dependent dehydrogenase E1 component subunit alpha [Spirochaetia bacterium]
MPVAHAGAVALPQELRTSLFHTMLRIREFEDRVAESYLRGLTAGSMFHLSVGEEAVGAGTGCALKDGDVFTTHHRGHGIFLARGADPARMFAEVFGRTEGYCAGKGGSMHIADAKLGHMGANAIVGGNIPISLGGGFSLKYQKKPGVSVAFFGDGALNQGVLYESMNMAALWKLPLVFAVVNNQYGMGTRIDHASACMKFVERAESFGVKGVEVDGMNVETVYAAASELFELCRKGGGPGFLIANCYRFYGHGRKDPSPYRAKDEELKWKEKDPVETQKKRLIEAGILDEAAAAAMVQDVAKEMDDAVAKAAAGHVPGPEELFTDVYATRD